MPSQSAARGQLRIASRHLSTENLQLPLGWETPVVSWWTSVRPEDEIHDEHDHYDRDNITNRENDLDVGRTMDTLQVTEI